MAFCAHSLGLQISNNGGVTSTQLPIAAEARRDLTAELVAPLLSSYSQYFQPPSLLELELLKQRQNQQLQPQTLAQLLGLQNSQVFVQQQQQQQPAATSPFLYLGQSTSSDPGISEEEEPEKYNNDQPRRRSDDESEPSHERNTYELYRPSEDDAEYVEMTPPPERQEPNYYAMKPRKLKKYSKTAARKKKSNVRRAAESMQKHEEVFSTNKNNQPENEKTDSLTESTDHVVEQSEPTSRLDFQMHGN
jgi:hypothetical protein